MALLVSPAIVIRRNRPWRLGARIEEFVDYEFKAQVNKLFNSSTQSPGPIPPNNNRRATMNKKARKAKVKKEKEKDQPISK